VVQRFDDEQSVPTLQQSNPIRRSRGNSVFATRSPLRPNPIALTTADVIHIDYEKGVIRIAFIDANDNTRCLTLNLNTPSFDKWKLPAFRAWCSHWPKSTEESATLHGKKYSIFRGRYELKGLYQ
jgi:tRNA (Thr-GGU) A37 N-methylase